MLNKLLAEEKELLVNLHANRHGVRESVEEMRKVYPDAHEYGEQTYYAYFRSPEGKEALRKETEAIREEAKTHSFAHRGSRMAVLVEVTERLITKVRSFPDAQVGNPDFIRVWGECRRSLQDLKAEAEILGLGDTNAMDIFTAFHSMVKSDKGLPDFVKDSLSLEGISVDN